MRELWDHLRRPLQSPWEAVQWFVAGICIFCILLGLFG